LDYEGEYQFDVIILDLGDPASCAESQRGYTQEFFWLVRRRLADGGVFAMQAGEFMGKEGDNFHTLYETVRSVFPHTMPYRVGISSFMSTWGFIVASGQPLNMRDNGKLPVGIEHRLRESKKPFPWFDAQGFTAMTWLPPQLRAMYEKKRPDLINKDDARTLQHVEAPESLLESRA
jgi:spermidine synthase